MKLKKWAVIPSEVAAYPFLNITKVKVVLSIILIIITTVDISQG